MSDFYSEWIVKRETPQKVKVIKILLYVCCALSLLFLMVPYVGIILTAGVFALVYLYHRNNDIEWEYSILQKELNVDKIMSKAKRKSVAVFDLTKVEMFAPAKSQHILAYDHRGLKTLDYSSCTADARLYVMVIMYNNELTRVVLEPTDAMLKEIRDIIPRQFHKEDN